MQPPRPPEREGGAGTDFGLYYRDSLEKNLTNQIRFWNLLLGSNHGNIGCQLHLEQSIVDEPDWNPQLIMARLRRLSQIIIQECIAFRQRFLLGRLELSLWLRGD
jgi:hypothetical protein